MRPMGRIYKMLYWPICRAYARRLGDRPADQIMCWLCSVHFLKVNGYWPDFRKPRTFTEKLWNRMLFDRNSQWTMLSDKWRVRDYVASKVGNEHLVPILWQQAQWHPIRFHG